VDSRCEGAGRLTLDVAERHMNPHGLVQGAVLHALADTGMGAALGSVLPAGGRCTTFFEIGISHFRTPFRDGTTLLLSYIPRRFPSRSIHEQRTREILDVEEVDR
jgi:acyl-coenzyme A thioesterase PaaI-like protein